MLFGERRYVGVGVANLLAAASFVRAGFYRDFGSKVDPVGEALKCGLYKSAEAAVDMGRQGVTRYLLSREA